MKRPVFGSLYREMARTWAKAQIGIVASGALIFAGSLLIAPGWAIGRAFLMSLLLPLILEVIVTVTLAAWGARLWWVNRAAEHIGNAQPEFVGARNEVGRQAQLSGDVMVFRYSKTTIRSTAAIAIIASALGLFVLYSTVSAKSLTRGEGYAGVLLALLFFVAGLYYLIYRRRFGNTIAISPTGISLQDARHGEVALAWSELHEVRERDFANALELVSRDGKKRICLDRDVEGYEVIRQIVRAKWQESRALGGRDTGAEPF